jgi:hypothetical protein
MADTPDSTQAVYSIVSWVRRGLASLVTGQPATNYAALPVSIAINGTGVNAPPIRLLGPGDITGLDARAVIRTDPRNLADSFEPNYLAIVELALPDLPWMFTPAGDVNGRLRPWICLIVVPDGPGATIASRAGGVSVLTIDAPLDPKTELPDLSSIDLWAHAQVTGAPLAGTSLNLAFDGDPSTTLSRLISPRKLQPGASYLACIVPTYHAGVNAALGLPVDDHDVAPAWDASVRAPFVLPVYYYFRFSTGPGGDFASLAEKIVPPAVKLSLGTRTMDVSAPQFGAAPVPGLTMDLGGALRAFNPQPTGTPAPTAAQTAYAAELRSSLAPPAATTTSANDPVVAPPTYGSAQSGVPLPAAGQPPLWLGDLNLDPIARVAASAGTQVVQNNQDALVASAWDQVGELSKANRLLRQAQLARQVTASLNNRHLQTVAGDGNFLQMTAPMHSRVALAGSSATLRGNIEASRLPPGAVSAGLRKLARPAGPIGRQFTGGNLQVVERLNSSLQVAAPLGPPRGMVAFDDVAPSSPAASTMTGIRISQMKSVTSAAGWKLSPGAASTSTTTTAKQVVKLQLPPSQTEGPTAKETPDATTQPAPPATQPAAPAQAAVMMDWSGNANLPAILKGNRSDLPAAFAVASSQAAVVHDQFATASAAAADQFQVTAVPAAVPPPLGGSGASPLTSTRMQILARIDPEKTIPARLGARLPLGTGPDVLEPVRTGPAFPTPMYSALADLSPEWMLPGISSVPLDCAALLAPNPQFVESYMIGLNEELSRELLWRQFPVDLQQTYFQYFWGASGTDIPQIRTFNSSAHLGGNVTDRSSGDSVVFLIRANLFRRYPNAVVSAFPAVWIDKTPGPGRVRALDPKGARNFPIFRGEIGSDVTFFGFEISDPRGVDDPTAGRPGWYFCIEEHLTEPRFGLEPADPAEPAVPPAWNDASWQDVSAAVFLDPAPAPKTAASRENVAWGASAASMAFILMREPVRVAMHALALLGPGDPAKS